MSSLKTTINVGLVATVLQSGDGGPGQATHSSQLAEILLANGIGFNQADLAFSDLRSLAASTTEDLDLVGGFTDGLGNTVSPAKVKGIMLINYSTTQTLQVGKSASNGWTGLLSGTTDTMSLPKAAGNSLPGMLFWFSPQATAITAGTGDKIAITNPSGSTASYLIILIGTSA